MEKLKEPKNLFLVGALILLVFALLTKGTKKEAVSSPPPSGEASPPASPTPMYSSQPSSDYTPPLPKDTFSNGPSTPENTQEPPSHETPLYASSTPQPSTAKTETKLDNKEDKKEEKPKEIAKTDCSAQKRAHTPPRRAKHHRRKVAKKETTDSHTTQDGAILCKGPNCYFVIDRTVISKGDRLGDQQIQSIAIDAIYIRKGNEEKKIHW